MATCAPPMSSAPRCPTTHSATPAPTLAYRDTRDLRAVQDMLGHQDPKTTARYARVVDRARVNPDTQGACRAVTSSTWTPRA
jgi:hypothetical protein